MKIWFGILVHIYTIFPDLGVRSKLREEYFLANEFRVYKLGSEDR